MLDTTRLRKLILKKFLKKRSHCLAEYRRNGHICVGGNKCFAFENQEAMKRPPKNKPYYHSNIKQFDAKNTL